MARPADGDRVVRQEVDAAIDRLAKRLAALPSFQGQPHLARAVAATRLSEQAERVARQEVIAARELDDASWTVVGVAFGVSRQAAHERFHTGPDGLHTRRSRTTDQTSKRAPSASGAAASRVARRAATARS